MNKRTAAPTAQPLHKLLSKPVYRNADLEREIANEKGKSELNLGYKELTDKDMEIVAYYAMQENKVSKVDSLSNKSGTPQSREVNLSIMRST